MTNALLPICKEVTVMNNCLCNLLDNNWVWLVILALIIACNCCGG